MVGFVSVVAFCGLLWSFVTFRCFCMMVCGAKCNFYGYCRSICDNYGIYGGTVGLQCISNFFLVIFTQFRGFQQSLDVLDGI